jgi:hypothetical protein
MFFLQSGFIFLVLRLFFCDFYYDLEFFFLFFVSLRINETVRFSIQFAESCFLFWQSGFNFFVLRLFFVLTWRFFFLFFVSGVSTRFEGFNLKKPTRVDFHWREALAAEYDFFQCGRVVSFFFKIQCRKLDLVFFAETEFLIQFAESRNWGAGTWILCFFAESKIKIRRN